MLHSGIYASSLAAHGDPHIEFVQSYVLAPALKAAIGAHYALRNVAVTDR